MPEIWLIGLIAGLAATVVMTLMMKKMNGSEPGLPQLLVGKVLGKPVNEVMKPAMAAHFGYGLAAGIVGLYAHEFLGLTLALVVWGIAWGLLLAIGAMMQVMVFGMMDMVKQRPKMPVMLVFVHLVWGLVFGGIVTMLA